MSNKKNIASILMLGATTIGLSNSMSTSAGLFDFLNWKEAKERDAKKNEQGYKTAEKVAKIFLEKFDKKEGNNKKNEANNVIAILEDLVLEKLKKEELEDYYKEKFKNIIQKLKLVKNNISEALDSFGNYSPVKGKTKNKKLEIIVIDEKREKKEYGEGLNEKGSDKKGAVVNLVDMKKCGKENFKKKEKFSFLGCLGKAVGSIKSTVVGNENSFDLKLYNEDKDPIDISITYTKTSDLKKYMRKLEERLLENVFDNTEVKGKIFDLRLKQIDTLINHAKDKGVSYEKIINTFFKKLDDEEGVLNYLINLFLNNPFSNNHLTNILWNKSSQESEKNGTARVVELKDGEKEILHELGYERNNSWFRSGVRLGVSIALTSAVVAGLSAAFPLIAGVAAAPIGVALTGFVATIVDRVAFKTRFKEYRKIKSWNPKNWEVQRFLKDTVKNTITSALWALSIGQVLPSFF